MIRRVDPTAKDVMVLVHDDHLDKMPQVEERLRARGLQVDKVNPTTGVISGSLPGGKLHLLKELPGVKDVVEPMRYRIAPPDSPVQ